MYIDKIISINSHLFPHLPSYFFLFYRYIFIYSISPLPPSSPLPLSLPLYRYNYIYFILSFYIDTIISISFYRYFPIYTTISIPLYRYTHINIHNSFTYSHYTVYSYTFHPLFCIFQLFRCINPIFTLKTMNNQTV